MNDILIAEDEFELSQTWARALKEKGHNVFLAISNTETLATLEARRFDLLIFDLFVEVDAGPEASGGITFVSGVRRGRFAAASDTPIIVVSGSSIALEEPPPGAPSFPSRLLTLGANRFLPKPFPTEKLVEAVEELLGGAGAPRSA